MISRNILYIYSRVNRSIMRKSGTFSIPRIKATSKCESIQGLLSFLFVAKERQTLIILQSGSICGGFIQTSSSQL